MKIFGIIILAALFSAPLAAQPVNQTITDPRLNREVLFGYCDREGLMTGEMGETYNLNYDEYQPEAQVLERLGPLLKKARILVVLGSWCSDSQEQVPRFFKILDQCGYKVSKMKMICVNRDKLAGEIELSQYHIERVPTFIFLKKGKELGRIVEIPVVSLEQDMVNILAGGRQPSEVSK